MPPIANTTTVASRLTLSRSRAKGRATMARRNAIVQARLVVVLNSASSSA